MKKRRRFATIAAAIAVGMLAGCAAPSPSATVPVTGEGAVAMMVGTEIFVIELYDNDAARAFETLLPRTITMSATAHEKYYFFEPALPADDSATGEIRTGDVMLYGANCLVVFYESFSTSYRYTRLGRITNPEGLAEALGNGSVTITFRSEGR